MKGNKAQTWTLQSSLTWEQTYDIQAKGHIYTFRKKKKEFDPILCCDIINLYDQGHVPLHETEEFKWACHIRVVWGKNLGNQMLVTDSKPCSLVWLAFNEICCVAHLTEKNTTVLRWDSRLWNHPLNKGFYFQLNSLQLVNLIVPTTKMLMFNQVKHG